MLRTLKDRIVVITGASGGMGEVLCQQLAQEGAKLALCDNNAEKLQALCARLPQDTLAKVVDVRQEAQVEAFFSEVKEHFGGADALVNLAGLSIPGKIAQMELSDFDRMMDVNVKGMFLCTKHFVPLAKAQGQVINLGSMAAVKANGTAPLYCTSKAAVNMFSQALTIQMVERDVRVTTVNPSGADTPFWGTRQVAREKLLKAEDVAQVLTFVLQAPSHVVFSVINMESFNAMK